MVEKKYLSIKEMISLPILSNTSISDDGRNIAFVKRTADWKENTYRNYMWVYEKDKGECYPLLSGNLDAISPLWSPDSRKIAFLSPAGDGENKKNQIFMRLIESRSSVQITDDKEGVSKFKWEPNGRGFYYITNSKVSESMNQRKELFGDFHFISEESQYNSLNYIDIKDRMVYQLTEENHFHIHEFDLSNDGEKVVLMAAPSPNMRDFMKRDLYILAIKERKLQKLNRNKLLEGNVYFSPEGDKVCYTASIREKDYYKTRIQENTLEIYEINNGNVIHPLNDYDSTVKPIRWTERGILIRWQDKTNYLIALLSDNGTVKLLGDKVDGVIMDTFITKDGQHLAYNRALTNETFEIYLDDEKITNENSFFHDKLKSIREIVTWKSSDGTEIEGVLSTPVNYDSTKKYPLLVVVHGGPAWASFPIYSDCFNEKYPVEQFIERGFIVLEPNYKGSSGYGNEFLKASYRELAITNYDDILAGVNKLVEKGMVDEERVGIMGWSNGGYIAAFCSTFSSRFKAISVGGGITNWSNHYVHTDIPYSMRMYLGNNPWDDPDVYAKTSPMTYIKSACTPTLIQHGDKDERVPITNAYALYQGLKDMEVETELVVFKGMAYSSNQPQINATIMNQNLIWFSHYLLGESIEGLKF